MTHRDPLALLQQEIDRRGWTQNELARRIGITSGHISHLMTGRRRPGLDLALRIERELGIKIQLWARAA